MRPIPYQAGKVSIGLLYRQRRSPEYAQWMEAPPRPGVGRWIVVSALAIAAIALIVSN